MKEIKGWVVMHPDGWYLRHTFRELRKDAITAFLGIRGEVYGREVWRSDKAKGFRVKRATLRVEE
jgi:hypothetical protein